MTESRKMHFIANARLKDIVGRGLINDDNIAIIELIKNAKDAGSKNVSIEFRRTEQDFGDSQIYIRDLGKGMTDEDLEKKWLNIAYSEKRYSQPTKGAYAGSKGIGRFSCDRLGRVLHIYTKTRHTQFVSISLDWTRFEIDDPETEIGSIETEARYLTDADFERETGISAFPHGTLLVIQKLRTSWSVERLRSLRKELEKFIMDPERSFSVNFTHWKYAGDKSISGPVENKIFEDLDFRTTSLISGIDETGSFIDIELRHAGDFIFKSREKNPYSKLRSIGLKLYFLNQPAKAFFKRRTGYRSIDYGSLFLFLNGFRVFPYGSPGDDWLGVDRRKSQGQRRFLGTRELVGFIEIQDQEDTFEPVSSREGLVENLAFDQLTASRATVSTDLDEKTEIYGYFYKLLRKLEVFVVDGLDWDKIARAGKTNDDQILKGQYEFLKAEKPVLETIDSVINIRSPSEWIEDVEINLEYLSEVAEQETEEYEELVEALEVKLEGTSIDKLSPAEKRDVSKFISRTSKEIAAKDSSNVQLEIKAKAVEKSLETETKKRLFAEYQNSADQERILQLHHQVSLIADAIWKKLDGVTRRYRANNDRYTKSELIDTIEVGIYELERIRNVTKLALKADFDLMTNKVNVDLIQFIEEYLENFKDIHHSLSLNVRFSNNENIKIKRTFRPIEITILIDNLLVNAGKAGATRVEIVVSKSTKLKQIEFIDNGGGLTDRFKPSDLFEKGISTTEGSGIGLSHAKQIIEALSGTIEIVDNSGKGSTVRITFG